MMNALLMIVIMHLLEDLVTILMLSSELYLKQNQTVIKIMQSFGNQKPLKESIKYTQK